MEFTKSIKKSFDFSPQMLFVFNKFKKRLNIKKDVEVLKTLLSLMDGLDIASSDFKKQMYDICMQRISICNKSIQTVSSPFAIRNFEKERDFYYSLIQAFFVSETPLPVSNPENLKYINIKDGILRIPNPWLIINSGYELSYNHALVCEFSSEPFYCVYLVSDEAFDINGAIKPDTIEKCNDAISKTDDIKIKEHNLYILNTYPKDINLSRISEPFGACIISDI